MTHTRSFKVHFGETQYGELGLSSCDYNCHVSYLGPFFLCKWSKKLTKNKAELKDTLMMSLEPLDLAIPEACK